MCEKNRKLITTNLAYTTIFQLITHILSAPTLPPHPQLKVVEIIDSLLSTQDFLTTESFPFILRTLAELTNPHRPSPVAIAAIKRIININIFIKYKIINYDF